MPSVRFSRQSGIALGPILFLLAVLGIIGIVLSAGSGGFSTAGVSDRIKADVSTQANLIRSQISACILGHGSYTDYTTYPQALTSTLVSNITCPGDNNNDIWTGSVTANLPPPTAGFGPWYYVNTNGTGGTNAGACIWSQPNSASGGTSNGLQAAATKFTTVTANDGKSEANFDPSQTHQRFVLWISTPPSAGTNLSANNPDCKPQ